MLRTTLVRIPKTRHLFHTSSLVREEWTKASLRRMKKVELTRLAKENNLIFSGTKNDIIIQLLTHQTAKIVGSNTPSIQTIKNIADPATLQKEEEDFEPDNAWMNAFEMKVAQRGSRKAMDDTKEHLTSKPHRYNDQIKPSTLLQPTQDRPEPTSSVSPVPVISSPTNEISKNVTVTEDLEGLDPQWVEAFELKVGSRGARSQLTDTLSPSTTTTMEPFDNIEFISIDKSESKEHEHTINETKDVKKEEKHKLKGDPEHTENIHNNNQNNSTSFENNPGQKETTTSSSDNNNNSRESIVNMAVGSSMFVWYYGEGLSKIWNFLTSSS
ncbi:unnamed protein product [Mucor hiemalis]